MIKKITENETNVNVTDKTDMDDVNRFSVTIQEVDTASINETEQEVTPQPKRRPRPPENVQLH